MGMGVSRSRPGEGRGIDIRREVDCEIWLGAAIV
jgi:hypothetical protein